MEQTEKTGADVITVVAESESMIFATRKEWQELPEICLGELSQHETMLVFMWDADIYMLLHKASPFDYLKESFNAFRLVRISIDGDSKKQKFYTMNLSRAEAAQLMQNHISICKSSAEGGK